MSGAPAWPPHFFDLSNPDVSLSPADELPWLIKRFVRDVEDRPEWRVDDVGGDTILLFKVSLNEREAQIGFTAGGVTGIIVLSADPSGWLRIEVATQRGVIRAWLDRPYEEYELWQDGATARVIDPPGRMGKKRNWLTLSAQAWPQLAPVANAGGWVNVQACEYLTVHVRVLAGDTEWRQTRGLWREEGLEILPPDDFDAVSETWEFPPGSVVRCNMQTINGREEVVAAALV